MRILVYHDVQTSLDIVLDSKDTLKIWSAFHYEIWYSDTNDWWDTSTQCLLSNIDKSFSWFRLQRQEYKLTAKCSQSLVTYHRLVARSTLLMALSPKVMNISRQLWQYQCQDTTRQMAIGNKLLARQVWDGAGKRKQLRGEWPRNITQEWPRNLHKSVRLRTQLKLSPAAHL